jgi:DNA-binding NtrC family response regulator
LVRVAADRTGGGVNIHPTTATTLARLLAWDAPFLPLVTEVVSGSECITLRLDVPGVELARVCGWRRGERAAVALQALAATVFLFERGWYPSRALLRGGRVIRGEGGPAFRLAALPRWRLDDRRLETHFRPLPGMGEKVLVAAVAPLVSALLPERGDDLARATASRPAWEAAQLWVKILLGEGHNRAALGHPAGEGRTLWARCFSLPRSGAFWVEEDGLLPGLVAAAKLAATGRDLAVAAGRFEEEDVARVQAHAAAVGRDCLVLTSLNLPGVLPLALAAGADPTWALGPEGGLAHAHAAAATEAGAQRPSIARLVLEAGAASGFARPPRPVGVEDRRVLASPMARRALGWLESVPVGLNENDLGSLADVSQEALSELERLGLAQRRRGAWHAVRVPETLNPDKLTEMAERLPEGSAAGAVVRALASGRGEPAQAWCETRLAAGSAREVLAVAQATAVFPALRLQAAESALCLGRLNEAEGSLQAVREKERGPCWHALAAWWAEQAGVTERAAVELAAATGDLPARLVPRLELVAAELARRRGDRKKELEHLNRAVTATTPALPEAALALAAWSGPQALRVLRRAGASCWRGDEKARLLQLLGLAAIDRRSFAAATTALRAALRAASGENLRLLGEVHADLGCVAILAEQTAAADRHLMLAENLLERCGSRRAVTLVRANRAVLACDRLDWRTCRELTLAARDLRGALDDEPTWLGELELARAELARGDVVAVQALLPRLEDGVARHHDHVTLAQALAGLKAHLALALGDLGGALAAAARTESGERELILALERADHGVDPPTGLPQRWGVALTAQLLAALRRGEEAAARARLMRALERAPREASVGLARLAALLARRGERLPAGWAELERDAETALSQTELEGWAGVLHGAWGLDPARLVRALDDIVNAGTDALASGRLEALGRVLGLRWLQIERGGVSLAAWGREEGDVFELSADGIRMRAAGTRHTVTEATLAMLARHLATRMEDGGTESARPSGGLLGESASLEAVREQVARWAPLPLTVLITGEPGTGKELVARELHRASRRVGPFVPLNCAGIPASLLEAELFGVVRGAYTGADRDRPGLVEAAEAGTLFLDEVGELPMELQGKLLRLLQDCEVRRVGATRSRTVDVRFVAATNRDLRAATTAGTFRQDLFYRLAVAVIEVPPLRERPEDVDALARHFASRFAGTLNRPGVRLSPAALQLLRRGSWPGNVRELESAVARAVAGAHPGEILGPDRFGGVVPVASGPRHLAAWPTALADFRRSYFAAVLRESGGNRSRAARRAGVSRQTLLHHIRELGIRDQDEA